MSSLNKVTLIGNIGADPDIRTMKSGDEVCNLSIATAEKWKDKNTGEKKEKTEWHRVVIFNKGLVQLCKNYLQKGSKIYLEGQLETRSWDSNGEKKYTTEIVLRNYGGSIIMLDSKNTAPTNPPANQDGVSEQGLNDMAGHDPIDDEIPF